MNKIILQKGDLSSVSFANDNSNNAEGVTVRVDATSTVGLAIAAAVGSVPVQAVTTIIETPGSKTYSYINEAAVTKVMTAAQQISADNGNAITVGSDGGFMLAIPAQLPDDQVLTGDNTGTVAVTLTPDTTTTPGQTNYTLKADLKVAATNPDGSANALRNTGNGFFVTAATDTTPGVASLAIATNHPSLSDAEATTPAYVAAAIAAIPAVADASATARGVINLTPGQVLGDGVKVMDSLFTRKIANVTTFDLSQADVFSYTVIGATTFAVSNTPAAGLVAVFILDLTNGGGKTLTWWSGVKWEGGAQPTLTTTGRDKLGFMTSDGGATWDGLLLGKDLK